MSISERETRQVAPETIRLRPMLPEDTGLVAAIERDAFPTTWPPTPFHKELQNRLARYLVCCRPRDGVEDAAWAPPASVPAPSSLLARLLAGLWPRRGGDVAFDAAAPPDDIMGFVGMWFMADEAHITAIAVREDLRGQGLGELLLLGCVELAILQRSRMVTLEVRVSNDLAQSLYRKYGFEVAGKRKRYYTDNNEDAYIMSAGAIQDAQYQGDLAARAREHAERWGAMERVLTAS